MATSPAEAAGRAEPRTLGAESENGSAAPVPSFQQLCSQYFDFVWKCARAFGSRPDEIDDIVQDVFLVAQRRHADLKEERLARSWIYSITRRVVSAQRRRRREHDARAGSDVDALTSPEQSPLAHAEHNLEVRVLSALLDGLDEKKREVLVLSEIVGMSGPEIAETIGVPMNTVYSRLRAAREDFDAAARRHRKLLEHRSAP